MANGPVSRISPIPETIALLEKLGGKNSHRCASPASKLRRSEIEGCGNQDLESAMPHGLEGYRPAAFLPISIALNPASPQPMTNTLKPCCMRISMSSAPRDSRTRR